MNIISCVFAFALLVSSCQGSIRQTNQYNSSSCEGLPLVVTTTVSSSCNNRPGVCLTGNVTTLCGTGLFSDNSSYVTLVSFAASDCSGSPSSSTSYLYNPSCIANPYAWANGETYQTWCFNGTVYVYTCGVCTSMYGCSGSPFNSYPEGVCDGNGVMAFCPGDTYTSSSSSSSSSASSTSSSQASSTSSTGSTSPLTESVTSDVAHIGYAMLATMGFSMVAVISVIVVSSSC